MKKVKGSMTVFVSMLSVVLIMASTVFLDFMRIIESFNFAVDSFALALIAANNTYNRDIFSDLDIELITIPSDEVYNFVCEVIDENQMDLSRLETEHDVTYYCTPITDEWYYYLSSLIEVANNINNTTLVNTFVNINNNYKEYSDETSQKLYSVLYSSDMAEKLSDHCDGKNMYQLIYDYLPESCALSDDEYNDRFYNNILNWCKGTERVEGDFDIASTSYSIIDELENSYKYGSKADIGEKGFKWFNSSDATIYIEGSGYMYKCDSIVAFAFDRYNCYQNDSVGKTGLKCEVEYMLYGNKTDKENVSKVLSEIFKLRLFSNLREVIECGLYEDDEMVLLAFNESLYDTLVLKNGGSVSWNKPVDDFVTTVGMETEEVFDLVSESYEPVDGEMTYIDYLKNQFYISCYSGQICCDETFYAHFIDMLEYAYDVKGNECFWYFYIQDYIEIYKSSYDRAYSTIGRILMENFGLKREAAVMY